MSLRLKEKKWKSKKIRVFKKGRVLKDGTQMNICAAGAAGPESAADFQVHLTVLSVADTVSQ